MQENRTSFYIQIMVTTIMSAFLFGYFGYQYGKEHSNVDFKLALEKDIEKEKESRDYLFRIKEDIVRFSILKDEKEIEKVTKILEDSLNRNKELVRKYEK